MKAILCRKSVLFTFRDWHSLPMDARLWLSIMGNFANSHAVSVRDRNAAFAFIGASDPHIAIYQKVRACRAAIKKAEGRE